MLARVSVLLGKINPALGELWGVQLCIFFLVIALTSVFLLGYVVQGSRVGLQLGAARRRITDLAQRGKNVEPRAVATVLQQQPFSHLWVEYSHTLHVVDGKVRATGPAEMFFTREALVDGRLFEDFTRHLPGVLTGLGIIGTFAGLLEGLGGFDATSSITAVAGLKHLLDGVAHAFTNSVIAIGCAMLVVFISKFALAIFYKQVEALNQTIDAMYATGAGEEYLSRLVHASENSNAHVALVKQELLSELARLLNALTDRQIEASAQSTQALGRYLGDALSPRLPSLAHVSPQGAVGESATTLADLEAPVAQLREATARLAEAVQAIQGVLAGMRKD